MVDVCDLTPEELAHPYPFYKKMREENPVYFSAAGYWVITRYKDVVSVLQDQRVSSDRRMQYAASLKDIDMEIISDFLRLSNHSMIGLDPPRHTHLRKIANTGFTRKATASWTDMIEETAKELLDRVRSNGEMDIVEDLSNPLPANVIVRIMGIPKEKQGDFIQWSLASLPLFGNPTAGNIEEIARIANAACANLIELYSKIISDRENNPGEDMVSLLVAAYEKDRVNRDEVISLLSLVMSAGFVTTSDLIPNGIYHLLKHPLELQKLRENPALIPSAVEEILRYDTSVPFTFRVAKEDLEIAGQKITKDSVLAVGLAAANHDPECCPNPDTFQVDRPKNRHISFALGPHYCLGAELARIEVKFALQQMLTSMAEIQFHAQKQPVFKCESLMFKGFYSLPVVFK